MIIVDLADTTILAIFILDIILIIARLTSMQLGKGESMYEEVKLKTGLAPDLKFTLVSDVDHHICK